MSVNGTVALTTPTLSQAPAPSQPPPTAELSPGGPTNVVVVSSVEVITPPGQTTAGPITVKITSTVTTPGPARSSAPGQSSSVTSFSGVIPVPTSSGNSNGSHGLGSSGKIAVAVVVPVVTVALIVAVLLSLLRRHRRKRAAEEDRRKEVEEYAYNPNQDPTLPAIATAADKGTYETGQADGYRGWGQMPPAAAAGRKIPALPSGNGHIGAAYPDGGTSPPGTFSQATAPAPDVHSGDSLVPNPHHPEDPNTLAVTGGGPSGGENRQLDIHRGASNASSQYSAGARSELSGEGPIPVGPNHPQHGSDGPYEVEGNYHPGGAYGEGAYQPYGGGQPVIRDVQARRNTRIENPTVFPQQGNAGISRNF
ncbi:hypothetical protein GP486_000781 [Trichoglossum hirsutum]|uniref:Transmembrane protein n=1 Tax=Trichoglossum hirsutum TaxID=265104 RepID=A0A9P8RTQ9_9PEZI|nr:hypothetical protein GP486_000781 [Trichoglossum hirsutum]